MNINYLREECYDLLVDSINENFSKYLSDKIWIDDFFKNQEYFFETNIIFDSSNIKYKDSECEFAIQVFEGLKELTPYQATNFSMWTLLSHKDLYSFVTKRWKIEDDTFNSAVQTKIKDRYICGKSRRGLLRHSIARLWWGVYLSFDENRKDKYELTKLLFSDEDLYIGLLEREFSMCKPVVLGVLKYFFEYQKVNNTLPSRENRRLLFKQLNFIGASTMLDVLSESDIYKIVEEFLKKC